MPREKNTVLVYIFTKWDYPPEIIESLKNAVDSVVSLTSIEERVIIGQGFMVTCASWTTPLKQHGTVFCFTTRRGEDIHSKNSGHRTLQRR